MVLTGAGQGAPSDAPWATAYAGPGPWGSLAPALPSQPSQAYEGIATLIILAGLTLILLAGAFERRDGRSFFIGLGAWALLRAVISVTWRDPTVAFGLSAGGLIAVDRDLFACRDRLARLATAPECEIGGACRRGLGGPEARPPLR